MLQANEPVHDAQELLADVLRASHAPRLDEVLVTPGIRELACLPAVVYREESQVIAFRLMELGLLRVRLPLLLLRAVEHALDRQHRDDAQDLF